MTVPLLSPDQAEFVEAVARRVVQLLEEREKPAARGLVDAAALARLLGLSRATVYEHADELGAIRVGAGSRSRLRFDVEQARAAWTHRDESESSQPEKAEPVRAQPRRRRSAARSGVTLLPVRGDRG